MLRETMTKQFNGELAEGAHEVSLKNWVYMAHATDPAKDYLAVTFTHNQGDYKRNMFDKDVQIMISHLRRQLGKAQEAVVPTDFLNDLIADNTSFQIWISYPVVTSAQGLKRVQNLNFLAPYDTMSEADTAEDMEVPN